MSTQDTSHEPVTEHEARSVTYHLFILVMTILSLVIMVSLIILPLRLAAHRFLYFIDLIICIIFFLDFLGRLRRATDRRRYFFRKGGWLDLIGSIPSIPRLPISDIIRLARLYRAIEIWRELRFQSLADVWAAIKFDRAQSAILFTTFVAIVMITISAAVILQFESGHPEAQIISGDDAFWWAFVTMTTVGYGDYVPVTSIGRFMAIILMTVGVAVFGVLTSYLATVFLRPRGGVEPDEEEVDPLETEISEMKSELVRIGETLRRMEAQLDEKNRET